MLFLLLLAPALSAQTTQQGLVRELSSGKKTISGVSILFFDAGSDGSDGEGKFKLVFKRELTPGSSIVMEEIRKNGYELVNEKEMQILKLSNDGRLATDIILAKAGTIATARAEYAGASTAALLAGLEREKKKLKTQLGQSKLDAEQYQKQLEALQKDFDLQQGQLNEYAEKFARTNFDDVDPIYKQALELYKEGKIKEAIAKIESIDPKKQTAAIIKEEKSIAAADAELNERKRVLAEKKTQQITMLRSLADMYSVDFNPLKAEGVIDQLLTLDSTDLDILTESADFFREQHRYDKAMKLHPKIVAHPQAEDWRKANAYSHLGELFATTGNLDSSLLFFDKFSSVYSNLFSKDPSSFHKNNLAISYSKLGETHSALGNLDKALGLYEQDLQITKELYEAYPNNVSFKNGLAISYVKLASIYLQSDAQKGIDYLIFAEQHFRELQAVSPQNATFKKYHEMVVSILAQLNTKGKASTAIRQKIAEEKDPAERYKLYGECVAALKSEQTAAQEISQAINSQSWYGLLTGQFAEAEVLVREGIDLDSTNKYLYTNLPAALLMQGKTQEALSEYKKWAKKPFGEQDLATYKDAFLADFKEFEAAGIIPEERKKDVAAVIKLLNEL